MKCKPVKKSGSGKTFISAMAYIAEGAQTASCIAGRGFSTNGTNFARFAGIG